MARAAAPLLKIIREITRDHLAAPTPCAEFDVRKLINHLLFWGPTLAGAGRKAAVPPPAAAETELDLIEGDWATALEAEIENVVAAWSQPAAWAGTASLGRSAELPASMVGAMALGELVVHGWDLARAIGQTPGWDDDVVAFLLEEVRKTADQGRAMGAYGPEVPVPPTASALDRLLGLTGRDPGWPR